MVHSHAPLDGAQAEAALVGEARDAARLEPAEGAARASVTARLAERKKGTQGLCATLAALTDWRASDGLRLTD